MAAPDTRTTDLCAFAYRFVVSALAAFSACEKLNAPADNRPIGHGRAEDIALAADFSLVSARVVAGATLSTILRAQNVAVADVQTSVQRAAARCSTCERSVRISCIGSRSGWTGRFRRFEYGDRRRSIPAHRPAGRCAG